MRVDRQGNQTFEGQRRYIAASRLGVGGGRDITQERGRVIRRRGVAYVASEVQAWSIDLSHQRVSVRVENKSNFSKVVTGLEHNRVVDHEICRGEHQLEVAAHPDGFHP